MKRNWISVLSVTLFATLFMIGCELNKSVQNADLITAEDDAIADLAYDDVFSQVDAVMNLMDQFGYLIGRRDHGFPRIQKGRLPSHRNETRAPKGIMSR